MTVFAIDPGYQQSAYVVFDGTSVVTFGTVPNAELLRMISARTRTRGHVLVVERIASFGMPVGDEVFETVLWSGRFIQAWTGYRAPLMPWDRVKRHEVKTALCRNSRAKDANIRQALIDRFGPSKEKAIGRRATPGPLYGISGDEWSALAVAVTWWDRHAASLKEIA